MLTSRTGTAAERCTKAAVKALKAAGKTETTESILSVLSSADLTLTEYLKDEASNQGFRNDDLHGRKEKQILYDLLTAWRMLYEIPCRQAPDTADAFRQTDAAINALINPDPQLDR